jgi:hypothetical protein
MRHEIACAAFRNSTPGKKEPYLIILLDLANDAVQRSPDSLLCGLRQDHPTGAGRCLRLAHAWHRETSSWVPGPRIRQVAERVSWENIVTV